VPRLIEHHLANIIAYVTSKQTEENRCCFIQCSNTTKYQLSTLLMPNAILISMKVLIIAVASSLGCYTFCSNIIILHAFCVLTSICSINILLQLQSHSQGVQAYGAVGLILWPLPILSACTSQLIAERRCAMDNLLPVLLRFQVELQQWLIGFHNFQN
jgi:hypothetical protein